MPTGIWKFSQKDRKLFYYHCERLQELIQKYRISGELVIYDDVCDDDGTEEVHNSGEKMA